MAARMRRHRELLTFTITRLAEDLREAYDVELVSGAILLHGSREERWDPPVRLAFTDDELYRYLAGMADDDAARFMGASPARAAYQLLHVHLDEEIACDAVAGSVVSFQDGRLHVWPVREPEPLPALEPGETYGWMTAEEYRSRYGRDPSLDRQPGELSRSSPDLGTSP